jgi:hypothetical protein
MQVKERGQTQLLTGGYNTIKTNEAVLQVALANNPYSTRSLYFRELNQESSLSPTGSQNQRGIVYVHENLSSGAGVNSIGRP